MVHEDEQTNNSAVANISSLESATNGSQHDVRRDLEVGLLPPFSFLLLSAIIKLIMSVLLFGPPRPEKRDESYKGRARILAKRLAQAGLSAWGLDLVIKESVGWQAAHGSVRNGDADPLAALAFWYVAVMRVIGVLMFCLLSAFSLPALLAYIYLLAPVVSALIVLSFNMYRCFPKLFLCFCGAPSRDSLTEMEMPNTEEACRNILLEVFPSGYPADFLYWHFEYVRQRECFEQTGVCRNSWLQYFMMPLVFGAPLPFFVGVVVRLYTGQGYFPALTLTLRERHFVSYMQHIKDSAFSPLVFLWVLL